MSFNDVYHKPLIAFKKVVDKTMAKIWSLQCSIVVELHNAEKDSCFYVDTGFFMKGHEMLERTAPTKLIFFTTAFSFICFRNELRVMTVTPL